MQNRLRKGEELFAQGRFDEAKKVFSCLLKEDPENAETLNNLGVLSYSRNCVEEAEEFFLRAVAAKDDYLQGLLNLSKLYQGTERWEQAADHLEKVLSMGSLDAPVLDQVGKMYLEMGQNEKAREVLARSGRVKKDHKTDRAPLLETERANKTSPLSTPKTEPVKVTMRKQVLFGVINKICYFPHPEVHKGQLNLSEEIFKEDDRETNVVISAGARIDLTGNVTIGPWVMIGEGTTLFTHDHYHDGRDKPLLKLQEERGVKWQEKRIGSDVWLHGCTVLAQVTEIPDGVVVGAGSILTKNPGPFEVWAGNPAIKVGER